MYLHLKNNGLSARRKTISNRTKIAFHYGRFIKRSLFLMFITTSIIMSSCQGELNGQDREGLKESSAATDSLNKPKVNIQVNRRYDAHGNLVEFDSTYSTFYSNIKGDTSKMDSLMSRFDRYFNPNHSSIFDNQFNSFFYDDSLQYRDLFQQDLFMKRFRSSNDHLMGMMQQMDSITNRFFQDLKKPSGHSKDL